MRTAAAILVCLLFCSCAAFRSRSDWTDSYPTDPASPWNRKVNIAVTNAFIADVVAELEKKANAQPGPKLSLGFDRPASQPWRTEELPTITFTATNICVNEAFRIIGSVAQYRAMFRDLDGVLSENMLGGEIKIVLTGRCVDAVTGAPLEEAYVSRSFEELDLKESGEFIYSTPAPGFVNFVKIGDRNYLMKEELSPQTIRVVVTAPGYQPNELVISPHGSILTYTNNIEMKPNIPTTRSAPAR